MVGATSQIILWKEHAARVPLPTLIMGHVTSSAIHRQTINKQFVRKKIKKLVREFLGFNCIVAYYIFNEKIMLNLNLLLGNASLSLAD